MPPLTASVVTAGTPGATTYCYQATGVTNKGTSTPGTGSGNLQCISTGNATLSGTNFNRVRFASDGGDQSMDYWRVALGGGTGPYGRVCAAVSNTSVECDDIGQTPSISGAPPTVDTSGRLYVGFNQAVFSGVTDGCAEFISSVLQSTGSACGSGGGGGFPIVLGSTTIGSGSTTTAVNGFTVNGVLLNSTGSTSLFLNQAGGYTTPAGGGTVTSVGLSAPAYFTSYRLTYYWSRNSNLCLGY